jgi:glyoxylase-like metal-dependent hydrolase (beta-lactamase superfamily II)
VTKIDAVLLTHYHDDHVSGCNVLRDGEGAEVWAADTFADVLEDPEAYDLPCLWYDPIPVDRRLALGKPFRWEEYEFTLHPLPGHTLYAVAISFEADGKRILVSGDQYQGGDGLQWNYVYQNEFHLDDYIKSAELYRQLNPDVILTGHWEPLWVQPGYFDSLDQGGEALAELHRMLLPLEEVDLGTESIAAKIRPYTAELQAGEILPIQIQLRNPFPTQEQAEVRLVIPEGWKGAKEELLLELAPLELRTIHYEIQSPEALSIRRARIAADITIGGRRFGQQAEALITVKL